MLFSSWENLLRVVVTGFGAYAALLLILRISGKRTLAKLNAFDLVVTVALGSTLASVLLPADAQLADGVVALAVLITAQYVVAWAQVRSDRFRRLVKGEPTLLFHRGEYLRNAMRRERVSQDEILAAMRNDGQMDAEQVEGVVLETDGTFSVLRRPDRPAGESTLAHLRD